MTMRLTRLPSGLTVVTDEMAHVETAAVGVWVAAGTRSEGEGQHGLAHFLEHMAFKGTRTRTAREISEAIEDVGGEINAATSVETTAFHARVLAENVPLATKILADILTDPLFDPADVERERNVILQEIGSAEDVPEDRAFDALPEAAFRGQPLGRRILGTRGAVESVDAAGLRTFFADHYVTPAMTVAAAGAVDHDRFVENVAEAFSAVPQRAPTAVPRANYTGGTASEADDSECQWILGLEGRPATHPDQTTIYLAALILGGGMSSRLFQALREDRGLVYDTSAFHWAFADSGVFAVHFATAATDVEEATEVALAEFEKAVAGVDEDELARAKAQSRAGFLMSLESCTSRLGQVARMAMTWGRLRQKDERIAEIEAVSVEGVRRVLAEMGRSTPTLVSVGPSAAPDAAAVAARLAAAASRA